MYVEHPLGVWARRAVRMKKLTRCCLICRLDLQAVHPLCYRNTASSHCLSMPALRMLNSLLYSCSLSLLRKTQIAFSWRTCLYLLTLSVYSVSGSPGNLFLVLGGPVCFECVFGHLKMSEMGGSLQYIRCILLRWNRRNHQCEIIPTSQSPP